ncbi:glycosyltransferase [Wukongibacter sp. M2B1]|uniref:glycosyltransferase n=1 Tax=Wukongibacter sp. M2B1 TaxID=3088895 RepID=UPI003D796F2D
MIKVSVIIPTYNYGKYICDAVDSILKQTYTDYEIIVVDDGSTDGTDDILKKYGDILSYYYIKNQGPAAARNFGIEKSKGKYISFLDADDAFLPEKLDIQVDILENNRDTGLVHSDFLYVNNTLASVYYHFRCKKKSSHAEALQYLWHNNYINTSTVMIVKDYLSEVGLFNSSYRYAEDYDLWLRLGKYYEFYCIHQPLVKTRSHNKNHCKKVDNLEKINCTKLVRNNIKEFYKEKGRYHLNIN